MDQKSEESKEAMKPCKDVGSRWRVRADNRGLQWSDDELIHLGKSVQNNVPAKKIAALHKRSEKEVSAVLEILACDEETITVGEAPKCQS